MKACRSFLTLLLVINLVLLGTWGRGLPAAAGPAPAPNAAEWRVCLEGPPHCDYTVIQDAVDAAGPGDTIKVAAGEYRGVIYREGVPQVVYLAKSITLTGGFTLTNWTTPDPLNQRSWIIAEGNGRGVYITGTITPKLEGFTIEQGVAEGLGGGPWSYSGVGGGIYVVSATATISNCDIFGNTASYTGWGGGGGVYLWWSNSLLIGNLIRANEAGRDSGNMSEGGGLGMSESAAVLERNTIRDNAANGGDGFGIGGGIYMECFGNPDHPTLHNNVLSNNTASLFGQGLGGGIFAGYGSNPTMSNTVLMSNVSGVAPNSQGSGLYAEIATLTMTHSTIHDNVGGNATGIFAADSSIHLVNSILAWQSVAITATTASFVTVDGVLWYNNGSNVGGGGTFNVTHAMTGTPNLDMDGYHVLTPSLAIDNGVASAVADDIDGQGRPYGAGPDLGVDEWRPLGCTPVTGATINGPTTGYTNTLYAFTAMQIPGDATPPFTFTWSPPPGMGQGMPMVNYTWSSAGTYVLTATVENCGGSALATHTITITDTAPACPYPLSDVAIIGPNQAFVGFPVPFAAAVVPPNATEPISYNWAPVPDSGQGTPLVVYTWATTGTHVVAVDAMNCGGSAGDSVLIDLLSEITGTVEPTVSLTIVYTDPQGVSTTVEIPGGAVTETTILIFQPVFSPTHPVSPGLAFANHNFDLSAYRNGLLPGFAFARPVTISINYSDADVRWIHEDTLQLYYWDGSAWLDAATTCTPPSVYVRDLGQNTLAVPICHLTVWSMMGMPSPTHNIYLPLVVHGN